MKLQIFMCFLAYVVVAQSAQAQAPTAAPRAQSVARGTGQDCISRVAATPGGGTSKIETVRLLPGNPMPGIQPAAPRRFAITVVVDTLGRADPATLQAPADLDSTSIKTIQSVLPGWRFSPARVSGCLVKQVTRVTFTR